MMALTLLGLRQYRLEITSQCAKIHHDIKNREDDLRAQRVAIARETNPWALAATLEKAGLNPGDALITRDGRTKQRPPGTTSTTPQVETDLLAPLRDPGAPPGDDPSRPRQ
jgi:hypothetical protein